MGGRSKPVELATRSFEKQGDAAAFFKAMLNRYRPGERVRDEDGLHVAALLERHTEYVAKVGCGVSNFQVMMTEHGTQCFRIIRKDGSATDFSIHTASPSDHQAVSRRSPQAFRRTVRFDFYKARDNIFATTPAFYERTHFPRLAGFLSPRRLG
ncbi:DCL family protein [Bradyrhizobium sp. 166]|nr:DCL family protein [Bradyrhizobium sp. 166]